MYQNTLKNILLLKVMLKLFVLNQKSKNNKMKKNI